MTAIVPKERPEISRETAIAWANAAGLDVPVFVLGRRGYFRTELGVQDDARGVYDDAIAFVTPDTILCVNANTNPALSAPGMAVLEAGIWRFKKAIHHPDTPKAYPCFMQAEAVIVRRDGTEAVDPGRTLPKYGKCLGNSRWEGDDFCIQIHHGFLYETASEGCQTVYLPQWEEAYAFWCKVLVEHELEVFPYVLTERGIE